MATGDQNAAEAIQREIRRMKEMMNGQFVYPTNPPPYDMSPLEEAYRRQLEGQRQREREIRREAFREAYERIQQQGWQTPVAAPTAKQFDALLGLLAAFMGLPEQGKAFLRAALERPVEEGLFSVLADWLEEQGDKAAEKFRQKGE